jgi:leucine-rich repeat protein SHOC2
LGQLDNNPLTSLPPELGLLTNLKRLFVRHPMQTDRDLTAVSRLQVGANRLSSLPSEIGRLTQLAELAVRNSN